jgi:hypothetical protein
MSWLWCWMMAISSSRVALFKSVEEGGAMEFSMRHLETFSILFVHKP